MGSKEQGYALWRSPACGKEQYFMLLCMLLCGLRC